MVRNPMAAPDDRGLAGLLESLPGVARVREAAAGQRVYLVGGAVRDLLLGHARSDLDVSVEGEPGDIAARLGGELVEHERFGTATVRVEGLEFDLATARAESYPAPGALPEVRPASIEQDLARRDFTINAMAIPLDDPRLIDPHGGRGDLDRGLLRVLHDGSFRDDPIRALRAARYAARFGFDLEPGTEALLRQADLGTVSRDRVDAELTRIAAGPEAAPALELVRDWAILELDPEAPALAASLDRLLGEQPWAGFAERVPAIMAAIGDTAPARALAAAPPPTRPSEAVAAASGVAPAELAVARAIGAKWLDRYVAEWRHVRLEIGGDDLLAAGVPEGPAVGRGLEAALARKLDGEVAGRAAELEAALEAAPG